MSTRIPASLEYLQSTKLKYLVFTCTRESALGSHWRVFPQLCFYGVVRPSSINLSKRMTCSIRSSADSSGLNSPGNSTSGRSRLVKVIQDLRIKVDAKFQVFKNGFPMKLLLFLVGFYCATAFATVIGQTGDWDVLCAGLAVILVEGIGALMYNNSFPFLNKIKGLITMFNFWKAGLSLGLFLDAFKFEIDYSLMLQNPFQC